MIVPSNRFSISPLLMAAAIGAGMTGCSAQPEATIASARGLVLAVAASPSPAPVCSLPICDQAAAIADLKAKGQQARDTTIRGLQVIASRSQKPAKLLNLRDFARAAAPMLIAVEEENWLVESVRNIDRTCTYNLALYSPIDSTTLLGYFKELPYEETRYAVLQFWADRVKEMETRNELVELTRYFGGARTLCTDLEDGDYVLQLVTKAENELTDRTFRLQPLYEGVYDITATCEGSSRCAAFAVDKMVIADTLTDAKIQVAFVNSRLGISIFSFNNTAVQDSGTELVAVSRFTGLAALTRLEVDFNVDTRIASGTIDTPEFLIRWSATPAKGKAPIDLMNAQRAAPPAAPVPASVFDATLFGTYDGIPAKMKVDIFEEDTVGATLFIGDSYQYRIQYQSGRYFPKTGILILAADKLGVTSKMTLAVKVQPGSNAVAVSGMNFSNSSGAQSSVEMRTQQ